MIDYFNYVFSSKRSTYHPSKNHLYSRKASFYNSKFWLVVKVSPFPKMVSQLYILFLLSKNFSWWAAKTIAGKTRQCKASLAHLKTNTCITTSLKHELKLGKISLIISRCFTVAIADMRNSAIKFQRSLQKLIWQN